MSVKFEVNGREVEVEVEPRMTLADCLRLVLPMSEFLPHLEILPPAQMRLWAELSEIPRDFVLYGGTALALHLGHRDSADFDFFGSRTFDVRALETGIRFLAGARIVQRAANTLTAVVERTS